MNEEVKNAFSQFMDHVKDMDTMINETNTKLEHSKMVIKELKTIYNVAIKNDFTSDQPKESQEDYDISKLLNSNCSLLLPDMEDNESLNLNEIQKKLKAYIEGISSNAEIDLQSNLRISIDGPKSSLNLQEYANDLNTMKQCTNHFNTIKLDNSAFKRDLIVEGQFIKLIDNVESFTNMIKVQTSFADCKEKWTSKDCSNDGITFDYGPVIEDILTKSNELVYAYSKKV